MLHKHVDPVWQKMHLIYCKCTAIMVRVLVCLLAWVYFKSCSSLTSPIDKFIYGFSNILSCTNIHTLYFNAVNCLHICRYAAKASSCCDRLICNGLKMALWQCFKVIRDTEIGVICSPDGTTLYVLGYSHKRRRMSREGWQTCTAKIMTDL